MRCSFCGDLDLQGTHHVAPGDEAAVCLRCLAAIDAGLRGSPVGPAYDDVFSLVLVGRTGLAPVEHDLHVPAAPCAWCGRAASDGVPTADMLGAASLCAPCTAALRARDGAPGRAVHYRQSAAAREGAPVAADAFIAAERYRLDEGTLRRPDPADDDALALDEVRGVRVRAWSPQAAHPWEGSPLGYAATAAVTLALALYFGRSSPAQALRLWTLAAIVALIGATLRRSLSGRSEERRLELVRPDGTTFLLAVDTATSDPSTLVTHHAPVLTAALAAMGRTPCPRFVDVGATTGLRVDLDEGADDEAIVAVHPARRRGVNE